MPNLLILQNSANLETSVSRGLVATFVDAFVQRHPDAQIVHRDFAQNPLPHLSPSLAAGLLPGQGAAAPDLGLADILTEELEAADIIVIGAPFYNFSIPSTLKAWLDHVVRVGRTFAYVDGAPRGLLPPGKKVIAFVASGGAYADGPASAMDFASPYLRFIFGFMGVTDVEIVRAEWQAVPERGAISARAAADRARSLAARIGAAIPAVPQPDPSVPRRSGLAASL
ncbi:MAG: NAD(P)H-dependent oxidoreductase [Alphaproteobacteria bacterium]|nr:NAD(P)H-dependent oxidoreductase [Alphaproteobacteria bacterium]